MLTILRASGITKLWPYAVLAGVVTLIIVAAYTSGKTSGSQSAKTRQLNDWLNTRYTEAKDRASIEAMSTSSAREQLRKRWSARD